MKISELMEELKDYDEDDDVLFKAGQHHYHVDAVELPRMKNAIALIVSREI